jgi:hypothetical protein
MVNYNVTVAIHSQIKPGFLSGQFSNESGVLFYPAINAASGQLIHEVYAGN